MLCTEYRCIFVHIPKTAGMSIERGFLDQLGLGSGGRAQLLLRPNKDSQKGPPRLAHLSASEYVDLGHLSRESFEQYYKFAVVRNPWDRMVSLFRYLGDAKTTEFNSFVFNRFYRRLWQDMYWFVRPQSDFITHSDGTVLVDDVLRFEALASGYESVSRRFEFAQPALPHVNQSMRKERASARPYQTYYRDATRRWIGELYAEDIERFGYQFE